MSILEDYEKRFKLTALDTDEIMSVVDAAEGRMRDEMLSSRNFSDLPTYNRSIVWLHDRLQAMAARLGMTKAPDAFACGWCFRAGGCKDEDWNGLPRMSLEDVQVHAQVCENNPLVQKVRRLEALMEEHGFVEGQAEDLRGRELSVDERGLRVKIRELLRSETTSGKLRQALGELVR